MGRSHKKHKKKRKEGKQNRVASSSSSDESKSSESEWVEEESKVNYEEEKSTVSAKVRDEWMSLSSLFPSVTRDQIRCAKVDAKEKTNKFVLDQLGQSERELNPYWKDGGTGLPAKEKGLQLAAVTVGDQGAHWLRKALQRAKEQAAEQGRSLDDVVSERWGSLEKLESMLAEAEKRGGCKRSQERGYKNNGEELRDHDRRKGEDRFVHVREEKKTKDGNGKEDNRRKCDDSTSRRHRSSFKRPSLSDDVTYCNNIKRENERTREKYYDKREGEVCRRDWYAKDIMSKGKGFIKPTERDGDQQSCSSYSMAKNNESGSSSKGWKRKEIEPVNEANTFVATEMLSKHHVRTEQNEQQSVITGWKDDNEPKVVQEPLTDKEMNDLGAKLVKAEILGNAALTSELKLRLEQARAMRASRPPGQEDQAVMLTHTNAKGFTRPLAHAGPHAEPSSGRRKGQKMETHVDGKRTRYFADDDKYSLKEIFEREKLSTVEDQNEVFSKLAGKGVGRDDSARAMDDLFEETARIMESEGRQQARERDKAIDQHRRTDRALANCPWCLESQRMLKHLIVAMASKCYLCLPPYQSMTEGHCLIVPTYHTPCATQLDEDVWEEIQAFRKAVTNMFLSRDEDVIFFESAMHLGSFPHMLLHCVPMPKETGDLAPIYFKKAILECEMEWSTNKKLVDLSCKDVRRAVPKGLPYFAVDFGLQGGYAHVIEDEQLFPRNFAQEIIGGMMDLDHSLWRKQQKEGFEAQRKKVVQFSDLWREFDITKKNK